MALKQQADAHAQLADRLQEKYQVRYQRIFISAHAVHGFITAGLTPSRQESINTLAHKILRPAGWEVVGATRPHGGRAAHQRRTEPSSYGCGAQRDSERGVLVLGRWEYFIVLFCSMVSNQCN